MESSSGEWLEKALVELCEKVKTGLDFDREIISGLVSYCELAPPLDAKEYLDVILSLSDTPCHPLGFADSCLNSNVFP